MDSTSVLISIFDFQLFRNGPFVLFLFVQFVSCMWLRRLHDNNSELPLSFILLDFLWFKNGIFIAVLIFWILSFCLFYSTYGK
ncbi:hypothetical protein CXU14_12800 [Akkermansia muciniphila]|nr:hypothetical protein CXU16_10600 [Akkermansia muciniphila]PNC41835.1 hypothetical protein CXU14_12800 [Akkermansia muciniphila]